MDFYVYLHRKATTGEIFYVGKGRKHRANVKGKHRSAHWNRVVAKHGLAVQFAATNLSEERAFEIEQLLIAMLGRQDIGTGVLINKTDGGEGTSGATYVMTAERKANIARAKAGSKMSTVARAKMAIAQKGRKHHPETLAKISASHANRPARSYCGRSKVAVWAPGAGRFESVRLAVEWLKVKGVAACPSNIIKCCKGKIKISGGYVWQYA